MLLIIIAGWIHIFPFCCDRCQGVYQDNRCLLNHKNVYLVIVRIRFYYHFAVGKKKLFSSISRTLNFLERKIKIQQRATTSCCENTTKIQNVSYLPYVFFVCAEQIEDCTDHCLKILVVRYRKAHFLFHFYQCWKFWMVIKC